MYKIICFTSILLFSINSFSTCSSFIYGRHKGALNEFASFDCKLNKFFYNSDLFILKFRNQKKIFIGEVQLNKNVKKIIKTKEIKQLKETTLKDIKKNHFYYLLIDSTFYILPIEAFSKLNRSMHYHTKKSKKLNGLLISKGKAFPRLIKNSKISADLLNFEKLKVMRSKNSYLGLYWSK